MRKLHNSQFEPSKYDAHLIEYEIAKNQAPYTDGIVEYPVIHNAIKDVEGNVIKAGYVEIYRVKLTEQEWNTCKYSEAIQRLVLS